MRNLSILTNAVVTLLFLFAAVSCGSSSSSTSDGDSYENYGIYLDTDMDETIYPSMIMCQAMNPNFPSEFFISVCVTDEDAKVKVTIEENDLMEASTEEHTMKADENGLFYPQVKWKQDALLGADQAGFINLSVVLEVDDEVKTRFSKKVQYRSINECVIAIKGFMQEEGKEEEYTEMPMLPSIYVNEDNPNIDGILAEILEKDRSRQFTGTQNGTDEAITDQMFWVWEYFSEKGTRYSSITDTSNGNGADQNVMSQYIRFFDQVIDNNQANCVDGACMLASIYRKIGLDVSLVMVPGHAYIFVKDMEGKAIVVETTIMGADADAKTSFDNALETGQEEYDKAVKNDEATIINIQDMRAQGFKPLAR